MSLYKRDKHKDFITQMNHNHKLNKVEEKLKTESNYMQMYKMNDLVSDAINTIKTIGGAKMIFDNLKTTDTITEESLIQCPECLMKVRLVWWEKEYNDYDQIIICPVCRKIVNDESVFKVINEV